MSGLAGNAKKGAARKDRQSKRGGNGLSSEMQE